MIFNEEAVTEVISDGEDFLAGVKVDVEAESFRA